MTGASSDSRPPLRQSQQRDHVTVATGSSQDIGSYSFNYVDCGSGLGASTGSTSPGAPIGKQFLAVVPPLSPQSQSSGNKGFGVISGGNSGVNLMSGSDPSSVSDSNLSVLHELGETENGFGGKKGDVESHMTEAEESMGVGGDLGLGLYKQQSAGYLGSVPGSDSGNNGAVNSASLPSAGTDTRGGGLSSDSRDRALRRGSVTAGGERQRRRSSIESVGHAVVKFLSPPSPATKKSK